MTAIYDYNQGIVNFKKFALQWVLIRLSRFHIGICTMCSSRICLKVISNISVDLPLELHNLVVCYKGQGQAQALTYLQKQKERLAK